MKKNKKSMLLVGFSFVVCLLMLFPFTKVNADSSSDENLVEGPVINLDDFAPENILKKPAPFSQDKYPGLRAEGNPNPYPEFPPNSNIIIQEGGTGHTIKSWGAELIQKLLGEGVDLIEDSVTIKTGHIDALGMFSNGLETTTIEEGIVMSTGAVNTIPGPNELNNTSRNLGSASSGDIDLQRLLRKDPGTGEEPYVTETTIIEFDFIPKGRKLVFDYVFASEEYQEYSHSEFNDVFGFFLYEVKPGEEGQTNNGIKPNIALLPDGKTPVAIQNINQDTNSDYYRNNDRFIGKFPRPNTDDKHINIEFDGLTTMLTAQSVVKPRARHHIKLAVGDVADRIYDSAVFLKANSFSSKYTVAYDPNGGVGDVPEAVDVTLGDPHTVLSADGLTYKGHKFIGWKAYINGEPVPGELWQEGKTFDVDDTTDLVAQWEELKYEVKYDIGEGIGDTPDTATYGEDAVVIIANDDKFNRPGYYFTGWKSSLDGNVYQPGDTFNITEDVKYTAQWLGTPVISADFEITPSTIKQTQKTAMKSTFENTGELPTKWTNVVYETTAFPVGVTPDLTTLKVNDVLYTGVAVFNTTTRVLRIEFPEITAETVVTYDALAAKNAEIGTTTMSYTVKGKEGESKKSNDQDLRITRNTVNMTIKFRLEDGVTPVKNIDTGQPIADKTVADLEVGSVFDVNQYKETITGFIYKEVENPANKEIPDADFTVIFKYKGDLSLVEVTPTIDFGENKLITFNHKDIWPLTPLKVDIMDTRESAVDWDLSLTLKDGAFKNSKDKDFVGEVRFVNKSGEDKELTEQPLLIEKRKEQVLGKSSITWDKKNEGIYLHQLPGNTNDTYTGKLIWTLSDGL